MTEVRVWIDGSDADPDGMTEFTLMNIGQSRTVANEIVPNSELPSKGWYSLTFSPDWESDGKQYYFSVHAYGESGTGPRIAYSPGGVYKEGKLFENSEPSNKDMVFQTGCIAGWKKISGQHAE